MSLTTVDHAVRWKLLLPFLLFMAFSYSCMLFSEEEVRKVLLWEDGVVETVGALCLLLASVTFLVLFFRVEGDGGWLCFGTRKNWLFLFLALIFLVGAGEEVAWGQHYLGYETPEFWKSRNVQEELTLHNLIYFNQREFGRPAPGAADPLLGPLRFLRLGQDPQVPGAARVSDAEQHRDHGVDVGSALPAAGPPLARPGAPAGCGR